MTSMLEPGIFRLQRPKKSLLAPPNKRRKVEHKIEEISFDPHAREDYLTGFHKRKVQRAKIAQAEAVKKAREEKIQMRKQLREERKQELEDHVNAVNALLKGEKEEETDPWDGFEDQHILGIPSQEAEYVDEDRYTTVTVEAVEVSKEGLKSSSNLEEELENETELAIYEGKADGLDKKKWPKKPRKKAFRYESKGERKLTRAKQKAGRSARADSRRGNDR